MKPKKTSAFALAFISAITSHQVQAGTTWDGTGVDTNINTKENWNDNLNPDFTGTASVTFTSANSTAAINTDVEFTKATFGGSFTIASGAGNFVLRGSTSGSTVILQSNSGASNVQINEQLLIESFSPTDGSQGTLLTINNNRNVVDTTSLNINNGIALAAGSTATYYDIRYANGSGGLGDTRIAGTITGLNTLANANSAWTGDLIIAGNQSLSSSNIAISSSTGYGTPTIAARLVLGETSSDSQTWNNITLNNVMNVAIGGTITANAISGNSTAKITGTGAAGATLKLSSGTLNATNIVVGGGGTGQNTLSLVKQNAGTLAVSGAHTYTGSTTVDGGTLTLNSGVTLGTSGIAVNNGGTLSQLSTTLTNSIAINAGGTLSGEGSTTGSLTFGAGNSNLTYDSSTTTGAFTADFIITSGASVLLTPSGTTSIGTTYTILKQTTGTFSGSPATNFIAASRGTLAYANSNKDLTLTPTAAASLTWKGNAANPSYWDVANTLNWTNGGSPDRFYANDAVTFDDNASSFTVAAQVSVSPGSIVINNTTNAYAFSGSGIVSSGTLTKDGSNSAVIGNTVSSTGVVVNSGTLTLNAANTIGASGIVMGGGILNLNAENIFTSNITLNGGTLNATVGTNATTGSLGSFAAARTITLNGGALSYGGSTISTDNLNLSVTANSSIGVSTATSTLRTGGTFSGSGQLTITGTGVVALGKNSANTSYGNGFTGDIVVSNGATLSLRNQNSMGSTAGGTATGTTTVQNGGTLLLDPFSQTSISFNSETIAFEGTSTLTNRLNGQSSLTTVLTGAVSTAGTLTVNTRDDDTTTKAVSLELSGAITGNGGINFGTTGGRAGTYILSNANGYLGATNVNSGTLAINGNQSSANGNVTVSNAGTRLVGTGTIGGDTTINSGAIHSAGGLVANVDKVGLQTFDETGAATTNLSYASGSIFEWDLNANKDTNGLDGVLGATGDNGVAGTDFDSVNVSGNLAINAAAVFKVIVGSGVSFANAFWTQNQEWSNIFSVIGTTTSEWSNTAVSVYNTSNVLQDVSTYGSFTITGSTLTWSAVPEPTSAVVGLLIGAGLLRRRRGA